MTSDSKNWSFITGVSPESRDKAAAEFVDAQTVLSAPRRMMVALRDVMALDEMPESKLSRIVSLIARELRTDVCSCFVQRAGEMLELYAASGLDVDEVRGSKVSVGSGLVGAVAAHAVPAVLPDITQSEQFKPRPETGGDNFKAFCGVPILRGGRVRGVLVVQNRRPRQYNEDVIDILQTAAMVLAELIVAGGIVSRLEIDSGYAAGGKPTQVGAISLGRGLAIGTAVHYEADIAMRDIVAEDSKAQKERLRKALSAMHSAIERMLNRDTVLRGTESRDILEAYQMFAKDRGWLTKIETAIDKGLSAEAAVQSVQNETRAQM